MKHSLFAIFAAVAAALVAACQPEPPPRPSRNDLFDSTLRRLAEMRKSRESLSGSTSGSCSSGYAPPKVSGGYSSGYVPFHFRRGGAVKGYFRKDGTYVSPHYRSGGMVKGHYRRGPKFKF